MVEKKLTIEELANLNDGTCIDIETIKGVENGSYALIKDEIDDYIGMQSIKKKQQKNNFFTSIPSTDLKKSIENVIKTKNLREEILKKNVQYEFDAKMARIRKIKSKTYRRMKRREKLKKLEMLNIDSDEESSQCNSSEGTEESNIEELRPVISFENKEVDRESSYEEVDILEKFNKDTNKNLVSEAFDAPGFEENEKAFLEEKQSIVKEDAPSVIEHYLPGWDDWAGEGIEFESNKFNTIIEKKDGIKYKDRKDFNKDNLIINEHISKNEKYKSTRPYGYTGKDYINKVITPISAETNSLRIFNKFVKQKSNENYKLGEFIKPKEFNPEY